MRLNEVVFDQSKPVDGYGPGFFRIGGEVYEGPVVVLPSGVFSWDGYADTATLMERIKDIDVLFCGTGAEVAHVPTDFRVLFEAAEIGVEPMSSPSACRTYNVLLSEGRRVGLALIPV